jgi:hypothetical protein
MIEHVEYGDLKGRVGACDLKAVSWPRGLSTDAAKALLREVRDTLCVSLAIHEGSGLIKVRVGMCDRADLGIEVWLEDLLNPPDDRPHDPALDAALEHQLTEVLASLRERRELEAAKVVSLAERRGLPVVTEDAPTDGA